MDRGPLDAEQLAPTPTGGLMPLTLDADGVMSWAATAGVAVPDHTHSTTAGQGGQLTPIVALTPVTGTGAAVLQIEPTITRPRIGQIYGNSGVLVAGFSATGPAGLDINANAADVSIAAAGVSPSSLDLQSTGAGLVKANGVEIVTISGTQTLTNKTLQADTVTQYLDVTDASKPSNPSAGLSRMYGFSYGGFSQINALTSSGLLYQLGGDIIMVCRKSGIGNIGKGAPVRIVGTSSGFPSINTAKADAVSTMPAIGIAMEIIAANSTGRVMIAGRLTGVDTSAFVVGDTVYVSSTVAGGLTATAPTGLTIKQRIGLILVSDAAVGEISVLPDGAIDGMELRTIQTAFTIGDGTNAQMKLAGGGGGFVGTLQMSGISSNRTLGLPDATDTLVGLATTDSLSNKTLVTPTIASFTNAQHNHQNAAGGGTLSATAALANGTYGYTLKSGVSSPAWVAEGIRFQRELQWNSDPGLTTGTKVGFLTAPTVSGTTISNQDSATRPTIRSVTGGSTGNSGGLLSAFEITRSGWCYEANFNVAIGNTITSYRFWTGLTSADLTGIATPTTQDVAAFSYDTARDGTVFFRTVTCDGTTATVTATSVAVTAGQNYNLRIIFNSSTSIDFYIDGVLTNNMTTHTPRTSVILGFQMSCTTLTNATRRIDFSRVAIMSI